MQHRAIAATRGGNTTHTKLQLGPDRRFGRGSGRRARNRSDTRWYVERWTYKRVPL
jgi:hypothetical protein